MWTLIYDKALSPILFDKALEYIVRKVLKKKKHKSSREITYDTDDTDGIMIVA